MPLNVSYIVVIIQSIFSLPYDGADNACFHVLRHTVTVAAGMTVICGGRKSDKLEYAFELVDDDRDGKLSRQGLWRFLRSFLTVLVSLSSANNVMKDERTISAVDSGASWAVSQAFGPDSSTRLISFDDFALWYTKGGYGIIPWLELLDLRKWVIFP